MTRFIFFCMAFIALSFVAVPVFTGISNERDAMLNAEETTVSSNDVLSFDALYEIAGADTEITPESLNNITPAAGSARASHDSFSSGFSGRIDSALENVAQPSVESIIAPEQTN